MAKIDKNFSRGFVNLQDNEDSVISDLMNEAIDQIEFARETGGEATDCLNTAFSNKDDLAKLRAINSYLSDRFLDAKKVFITRDDPRKEAVEIKGSPTLLELNNLILKCDRVSLPNIHFARGESLYQKKQFLEAVKDFELCIREKMKSETVYKVHHKLAQTQAKLGNYTAATEELVLAISSLENAELSETQKKQFRKVLEDTICKIKDKSSSKKIENHQLTEVGISNHNPELPGVDSRVEIKCTLDRGRFATAREAIPGGCIVAAGPPAVFILNPDQREKMFNFCSACLLPVSLPVPCYGCQNVVFCSSACREEASSSYHRFECELDLYSERQRGTENAFNIFMTLKAIFSRSPEFFTRSVDLNNATITSDKKEDEIYIAFWNMVTHRQDRNEESMIKCLVITLFLLRCVRLTSYLETPKCEELTKEEEFIGMVILHFFMVQDMNSHPIFGLDIGNKSTQISLDTIGSAIYPIVGSYFNHSCSPNTLRVNVGRVQLLIASRRIEPGEEVSDIYSMHYSEVHRERRSGWLERNFHFLCTCQACQEDWPDYNHLDDSVEDNLRFKLETVERSIASALKSGDHRLALDLHLRDLELLEAVPEPHALHVSLRNSLQFVCWRFYASLAHNCIRTAAIY